MCVRACMSVCMDIRTVHICIVTGICTYMLCSLAVRGLLRPCIQVSKKIYKNLQTALEICGNARDGSYLAKVYQALEGVCVCVCVCVCTMVYNFQRT